ncbi:MAG: nicotinate phosphoribosyltransferase [Chloroflexi bacterium]|nr:nicotinate phosphoribosyltransferase [Chloroflexota bacterium]
MRRTELSPATFTDLYELTMAQAYWRSVRTGTATFSLMFRDLPENRGYYVAAGLTDVLDFLEAFEFTDEDIIALDNLSIFDRGFLRFLAELRFEGEVRAVPEGTVCGPESPVLEVTAPVIQAQIVETFLLNQIHVHSLLTTKASRVVHAAQGKTVVDFGARRTQGTDAAEALARASYLAGFAGTSNVQPGARYGIPLFGTMAHSFVESFPTEEEAFRAYAETFPDRTTLLVDTYSTENGLRNAVKIGLGMKKRVQRLNAVRLDSGDLGQLARTARRMLDEAGLGEVQVFASGGLDEFSIDALVSSGAPIDGFGVGTKVGVSADAPALDCAYKLVAYEGRPVMKLSAGKRSLPGAKQVFRKTDADGVLAGDVVGTADEAAPESTRPLLEVVMENGRRVRQEPGLDELRERFREEFARLPERHKALKNPTPYPTSVSTRLKELTERVTAETKEREGLS